MELWTLQIPLQWNLSFMFFRVRERGHDRGGNNRGCVADGNFWRQLSKIIRPSDAGRRHWKDSYWRGHALMNEYPNPPSSFARTLVKLPQILWSLLTLPNPHFLKTHHQRIFHDTAQIFHAIPPRVIFPPVIFAWRWPAKWIAALFTNDNGSQ